MATPSSDPAVGLATTRTHARVGLLGNPSDGYGGRVIACTLADFAAEVEVSTAESWRFEVADGVVEVPSFDAVEELLREPVHDGVELLAATLWHLACCEPGSISEPVTMRFRTTIPRQVGLAGSSAVVIGALRALGALPVWRGHRWDPVDLARMALAVEVDTLGWVAGPQDRVIQAHGGVLDMDFARPWDGASYHRLDPRRLPPFFVAWDRQGGDASDVVHSDVRRRYDAGDTDVVAAMPRFAEFAGEGRAALDAGATDAWPDLLDQSHRLRSEFWDIRPRDIDLVAAARSHGAGVAFAGSGGAVVGVLRDPDRLESTARACAEVGAGFVVPRVGAPHA